MALFANLFHVGKVVAQLIDDGIPDDGPPTGPTIQVGPPLETVTGTGEEIRVTLLWVTPQPAHRNDPVALDTTGMRVQPPMTLSAFFLITTYGSSESQVPERAHELLGNVIQIFHTNPTVTLTNTAALPGEGKLTFIQAPMTPELMEHVFTPLQTKHRPWVLFEVSPVQLPKLVAPEPAGAQVRPDGITLVGPERLAQPQITRITPPQQGAQGDVQLDVDLKGNTFTGVFVGPTFVPAAGLSVVHANRTFLLTLPSEIAGGQAFDVRLQLEDPTNHTPKFSNTERLGVLSTQIPTVDAPGTAPAALVLTLTGRALTGAVQTANQILIWPDAAVVNPDQVTTLEVATVTETSVQSTVTPASLGLGPGLYRAAVKFDTGAFAPWVLLELT